MKKDNTFDYELIDCGDEKRTERFGDRVIHRPCPMALWHGKTEEGLYTPADATFVSTEEEKGWQKGDDVTDTWNMSVGLLTAELRFSPNGQVGIFPEQYDNWQWIAEQVAKRPNKPLKVLNLFGYTGLATLHAIAPHTEVCHVDGAKSSINWAKRNAELSGLSDANVRWICDDAVKFLQREVRRGNKYDAIILDPPAFGRGGGNIWKIEKDLPRLMQAVREVLVYDPAFVILTCHAPRHFSAQDMAQMLQKLPQFKGERAEAIELKIPSKQGNPLIASFGARIASSL